MDLLIKVGIVFFIIGIIEYIFTMIIYNLEHEDNKYLFETSIVHLCKTIILDMPKYIYEIIGNILQIIFSPRHFFKIIANKLNNVNYKRLFNVTIDLPIRHIYNTKFKELVSNAKSKFNINQQIKLYYSCIADFLQSDNSTYKNRVASIFLGIFIFLLQFGISFATTLAGAKLMLGSISPIAPWIFTFVVQGLISILSVNAFQKNRNRKKYVVVLSFVVLISVFFSYTGIVVAQDSPLKYYRSSYESYEQNLKSTKQIMMSGLLSKEAAIHKIEEMNSILKSNYAIILNTIDSKNSIINDNSESLDEYRHNELYTYQGDKKRVNQDVKKAKDEIKNENSNIQNDINSLKGKAGIFKEVYGDEIAKIPDLKTEIENYVESLQLSDDSVEKSDNKISLFPQLITISNELAKKDNEVSGISEINEQDFRQIVDKLKLYDEISDIEVVSSDNIFNDDGSTDKEGKKQNKNNKSIFDMAILVFEADMSEELNTVSDKRNLIQNESNVSYRKIEAINLDLVDLKDNDKDKISSAKEKLDESKNEIQKLPNVYTYSLNYLLNNDKNVKDFILILIFAFIIDFGSMMLGYVKEHKTTSFIYVKSSKDYFNEYGDVFEILFSSLMKNFTTKLKKGDFLNLDSEGFKKACLKQATFADDEIKKFLNEFKLSEGTWAHGYNLKYDLGDMKSISNNEIAIISTLLKTGLAQIITYYQYNVLSDSLYNREANSSDKSLYPNKTSEVCDDDDNYKYYLLLRSNGENFIREYISFSYSIEEEKDDGGESE